MSAPREEIVHEPEYYASLLKRLDGQYDITTRRDALVELNEALDNGQYPGDAVRKHMAILADENSDLPWYLRRVAKQVTSAVAQLWGLTECCAGVL